MVSKGMISTPFEVINKQAKALDKNDKLGTFKRRFALAENCVYLDGNSLGALPISAKQRAVEVIEQQWGEDLITSWNKHNWIDLPTIVGEKIARIIGASKGQTICCDSISVNLFKLVCAALDMQTGRKIVLSQADNFPTDLYMVQGVEQLVGEQRCELKTVQAAELESALSEDVAVLLLTQVNYRTGYIHDMAKLTEMAHAKGIYVIWDLAHSAGVLDLQLDECNVDFAVGCTYKYLNGGPGAPGFMYVAEQHQAGFKQPLFGWMGHKSPFEFTPDFVAKNNIEQCLTGTPTIISMSILDAALDVFEDVRMSDVAQKSQKLTDFFIAGLRALGLDSEFNCISPKDSACRGSQVALNHSHSYAICQALISQSVIADFRAPDTLRLGFAPLYISFSDVAIALQKLADIVENKTYLQAEFNQQSKVT